MQVTLQELYEETKNELAQMYERALIAESLAKKVERENRELREKLSSFESEDGAEAPEGDAFLEKLKNEVKD